MKSILRSLFVVAVAMFGLSVLASFANDVDVSRADKSFLQKAYQDSLAEIDAARLGLKSANADVKTFADRVAADLAKANAELKTLAGTKQVTLSENPSLIAEAKSTPLGVKSDESFDKAFAQTMIDNQKRAIDAFEKAASEGKDPDVKAFAAKILPTLKVHLSMAEELQSRIGK
ncbi:DUF4142 domain-containing protein [Chthoniobacter flavus]|nr:DUF4142 domain-containing protein [Chthoniobacter flavus]